LKIPFGDLKKYKVWAEEDFQNPFLIFFYTLASENARILLFYNAVLGIMQGNVLIVLL
jgi:hypothetical protein